MEVGWGCWGPGVVVVVAGCPCPPRQLGRWQTLRELGAARGLLLISMATAHFGARDAQSPACACACARPMGTGKGTMVGRLRPVPPRTHSQGTGGQTPLRTPSPVPVTCGSGCCTLSCASISSLSICSSREARIWVGKAGVREGWDPPGAPPAPPRAGTGLGENPEMGARGQKWGAWGWV